MRDPKKFKLSEQSEKDIRKAIRILGKELKSQMEICEIDHMKVSLDLNFTMPGPFMGVKFSAFKSERTEVVYDDTLEK